MPKLSVVIITFNEEKNIASCLDSIQGIADDIVVLDSFSTDKTSDICKQYALQFIQRAWEGYSALKITPMRKLNTIGSYPLMPMKFYPKN